MLRMWFINEVNLKIIHVQIDVSYFPYNQERVFEIYSNIFLHRKVY